MKSRLVVCLAVALGSGLGGCKQRPRVDRPAPPADVVTAYVESLVAGRLDPIWVDEWEYAQELERATLGLGLTDAQKRSKARELRAQWEHSIVAGRNQVRSVGPMGGSACSYFIRPGATVAVLEAGPPQITPVRVVNFERTWAVPVRATYGSESKAPLVRVEPRGVRRLKEALLRFTVFQGRRRARPFVSGSCSVEENRLTFWPIPSLDAGTALTMAKAFIERLEPRVQLHYAAERRSVRELRPILEKHGIGIGKEYISGSEYFLELTPPDAWASHELPPPLAATFPPKSFRGPRWYRLSEATTVESVGFRMRNENEGVGDYRVVYSGCTPVCALYYDPDGLRSSAFSSLFQGSQVPKGGSLAPRADDGRVDAGPPRQQETKTLVFLPTEDGWKVQQ